MRTAAAFATLAILASTCAPCSAETGQLRGRGSFGQSQENSLLQTYDRELSGEGAASVNGVKDTPVTRVVNLLKEMSTTLSKEMEEDEALYHTLACWCNNGEYEKGEFIEATDSKILELQSTIESLTAKSAELATAIKELEAEVAADKAALAEATELREKQQQEFHGAELDSIQAVENTKAALEVLAKHHGANAATPWMQSPAGAAYLQVKKDGPWEQAHEERAMSHELEDFMRHTGFDDSEVQDKLTAAPERSQSSEQFLQSKAAADAAVSAAASEGSWSAEDSAVVRTALRAASKFKAKHGETYMPSYSASSGEIVGVLKELKEEMEADLSEAQKTEQERAATFAALRAAKTQEIESGEAMAEKKEDEKATTDNDLAEAKEDLGQEGAALAEAQEFLKNLKTTCAEADKNFEARKAARLSEIEAVGQTITILTKDEARDAMAGTYSFLQVSRSQRDREIRNKAAAALRKAAQKSGNPDLSVLATTVELDAFTKVKKAIDDMISMLKTQQDDEVKFTDWCKAELQANEMSTSKAEDKKADLEAEISELAETIKSLEKGIAAAQSEIAELQTELQRATEDRIKENLDYQKTVADQTVTIAVLKKALDRLATYYDKEGFLQRGSQGLSRGQRQTPPVPQMEYKPSEGSTGVMQMIEKLIYEAKDLMASAKKGESSAQAAYETHIAETNGSVKSLQDAVVSKTKAKSLAIKTKFSKEDDVADTMRELDGLYKYNADLHSECDYVLKNFMLRQSSRSEEIEALQQAKQILSGATLG